MAGTAEAEAVYEPLEKISVSVYRRDGSQQRGHCSKAKRNDEIQISAAGSVQLVLKRLAD